jgi:hypothetical protein
METWRKGGSREKREGGRESKWDCLITLHLLVNRSSPKARSVQPHLIIHMKTFGTKLALLPPPHTLNTHTHSFRTHTNIQRKVMSFVHTDKEEAGANSITQVWLQQKWSLSHSIPLTARTLPTPSANKTEPQLPARDTSRATESCHTNTHGRAALHTRFPCIRCTYMEMYRRSPGLPGQWV